MRVLCRAESFCVSSGSINYDIRGCIGDNAKWLDDTCVLAYLTEAGYLTRSFGIFIRIGPLYAKYLREIHFHCIKLSAVRPSSSYPRDMPHERSAVFA